jgi:hypothetical protein
MSYDLGTFQDKASLVMKQYANYANLETETQAIATALGTDTTTHDATIKTAPVVGLQPGQASHSPFTNDLLIVINRGKAGNLSNSAMAAELQAVLPPAPPVIAPNQNFNLTLPASANQIIGAVSALGNPTSFAISAASNPNGHFAISNSGQLTVTAAGAAGIVAGNDILGVSATNAGGESPIVNVTVSAA